VFEVFAAEIFVNRVVKEPAKKLRAKALPWPLAAANAPTVACLYSGTDHHPVNVPKTRTEPAFGGFIKAIGSPT
jgi:hypothetical protein